MARTFRWLGGDAPDLEGLYTASTEFAAETAVTAGAHSKHSYKATFAASTIKVFKITVSQMIGTQASYNDSSTGVDHLAFQMAIRFNANPADPITLNVLGVSIAGLGTTTSTTPTYLNLMTDGTLELLANDSVTVLDTSPALAVDTWHYFLWIVDLDQAADTFRTRILKWTGSSWDIANPFLEKLTTGATGVLGAYNVAVYCTNAKGAVNPACIIYWDDMVLYTIDSDADIRENQLIIGQQVTPSGTGTDAQWTTTQTGVDGPDFTDVDDYNPDDDTSYNESTLGLGTRPTQTYTTTDMTPELRGREIICVTQCLRARSPTATASLTHRVREQGVATNITGTTTGTPYLSSQQKMLTPPSGGTWTETIINGAEMGIRIANLVDVGGRLTSISWVVWTWSAVSLVKQNRSSQRAQSVR